jgi:hypothetical protein
MKTFAQGKNKTVAPSRLLNPLAGSKHVSSAGPEQAAVHFIVDPPEGTSV